MCHQTCHWGHLRFTLARSQIMRTRIEGNVKLEASSTSFSKHQFVTRGLDWSTTDRFSPFADMLDWKKAWVKLIVPEESLCMHQVLPTQKRIQTSGINGKSLRYSMETRTHTQKCGVSCDLWGHLSHNNTSTQPWWTLSRKPLPQVLNPTFTGSFCQWIYESLSHYQTCVHFWFNLIRLSLRASFLVLTDSNAFVAAIYSDKHAWSELLSSI